ncbi:MAG: hypothetical protein JHD10_09540 [Sphingomonadaceae bacterium]|jgi:hypothetical protein|nr:hypothetical protein [Sphingomonadaceae bacterium]
METRVIVAFALCAAMAVILAFTLGRYVRNKRQFKLRQMGRGKNAPSALDGNPDPSE